MTENPFAAPLADTFRPEKPFEGGIYNMDGRILVVDKRVDLPSEICIKSNGKAAGVLKRKLTWHHPAVYLALLCNLLIFLIVALATAKRGTVHIGLSEEWFARRRRRIAIGWGIVALAALTVGVGFWMIDAPDETIAPMLILVGVLVFIFGALGAVIAAQMVRPHKITDTHIFIAGAHRDYVARFPRWEGG